MQTPSQFQQQVSLQPPKIYFSQKVFGKPTKNRTEDPTMFELLTWSNHGSIESSNFKKKQRFTDPEQAYMSMISKQQWISETKQNYLNYHENALEVNQQVFQEVQNYIHSHQSKKQPHQSGKSAKKNNQNQRSDHQGAKRDNFMQQNQNQRLKVPEQSQKWNNHLAEVSEKQNNQARKKDMRKRPNSAKNISNLNSPKMQASKQMITVKDDQSFEQTSIHKREEITEEQQEKLIDKFKQTTRWIPNSSFTTYFGKPPFENYGRGNTKPIDGGLVYGTYLYSHNVYPHRGANSPSHVQTYPVALMKAKSMGRLVPTQPKTACKYLENKINNEKERQYDGSGAIEAQKNNFERLDIEVPDLHGVQKFGGTKTGYSKTKFSQVPQQLEHSPFEGKKYSNRRL